LGIGWVNTSWVVGTDMEHNKRMVLGSIKVLLHAVEVKTLGTWVVVSVSLWLVVDKSSNGVVNWPGWLWNKNIDVLVWVPLGEESESESERSSS